MPAYIGRRATIKINTGDYNSNFCCCNVETAQNKFACVSVVVVRN